MKAQKARFFNYYNGLLARLTYNKLKYKILWLLRGRKTDLTTENYRCFPDGERSGFTVVEWGGHAGQMSAKVP